MDTKLRSYSHSVVAKVIAFILVVVSFTSIVVLIINTLYKSEVDLFDSAFEENYYLSINYGWEVTDAISDLTELSGKYKSEENIKAGKTIYKEDLRQVELDIFERFIETPNYNNSLSYEENLKIFEEKYIDDYKDEIESRRNRLIQEDLRAYKRILSRLKSHKGIVYYVKQGDVVFTNRNKDVFNDLRKYPSYVVSEKGDLTYKPMEFKDSKNHRWVYGDIRGKLEQADQLYLAFTDEYMDKKLADWAESRRLVEKTFDRLISLASVLILSLIYLILVIGRKNFKDKEVQMAKIDKLYTDINIIFILTIIPIWAVIIAGIYQRGIANAKLLGLLTAIDSVISCALVLALLLSLVRHIKRGTIFAHSLLFTVVSKMYRLIKDIYDGGSVATKVALAVIVYPIIAALTLIFAPITIGLAVWLANKKVREYLAIKEGVAKIKNGDIGYKIDITKSGEFKKLADDINSIGEGFNSAISNELKSEKLKTELITNVSHDIRTPLTSIITYVDLLKKEKDESKRKEYVEIIEQKSLRLKTLTDDLFEASKASSGNIPVNFEKIDIVSLITQGLGELDTQVKKSQLDFKISKTDDKIYVNADGKLLWRSIENLLTNIFKYSLKGSRVYIDIEDLQDKIELSIKNISAYELNISSDELLERFKRGDESRTSEGSGLGLSISKSLIEAQGGKFDIKIDGDLFKVVIVIEKYK